MRWIAGWLIILVIAGCTDRNKIPSGIIEQPRMEKILWDMIQADRYVASFIVPDKTQDSAIKKEKAAALYEQVFRLNKISRDDFLKSYKFYLGRPDLTKIMFDSISSRAEKQRGEMYRSTFKSSMLTKRDSLLRADSIRRADSIEKIDLAKPSTEQLFADSVLDKKK
jgi:hypothetical protein